MTREEEIRNPILNPVLMPTIPTHQFPLHNVRLEQQPVKILEDLFVFTFRFCLWDFVEAELLSCASVSVKCKSLRQGQKSSTHLLSGYTQTLPVYPGQDIADEIRLEVEILLLELGVAEVQREGGLGCFAALDGAGEEVGCY